MFLVRRNGLRCFSARAKQATADFNDEVIRENWKTAKPFEKLPGPSTFHLLRNFMPGGKYTTEPFVKVQLGFKEKYGPIYKLNGTFRGQGAVILHDPKDFEIVFRTEGSYPFRPGFDSITYYRKVHRKEKYTFSAGLQSEQRQDWRRLRHKVNGVMLKPQLTKAYTSAIDEVTKDFVKKLHNSRDSNMETPADFFFQLNLWILESIAYITMNTRLGILSDKPNENIKEYMRNLKVLAQLFFEIDFQPSVWRIYKTHKFNLLMKTLDESHDLIKKLLDQGVENLKEKAAKGENGDKERSVLEKLSEIDKDAALLMATDLLFVGVDNTSSATFSVICGLATNPEKQNILREELIKILPEKDTPLTSDNMANLPYLRACIKEALRLMPVISTNNRKAGKDIVLKGYQIPKDTNIFMLTEPLQRDEHYFPEPNSFQPERWLRTEEKHENYNPFAYLPFGFGIRNCVGRRFAELQMESLVTRLVRNYHLEWHYPRPAIHSTSLNLPSGDLKLRLRDYQ